jgi:thymidylate kinase
MKYIELLGLPGSGKTTLAQNAVTILQAQQSKALTRLDIKQATMRALIRDKSGVFWSLMNGLAYVSAYHTCNLVWDKTQCLFVRRFMQEHPRLACQLIECVECLELPPWLSSEVFSGEKLMRWNFDLMSFYQASCDLLDQDTILLQEEGFGQHAYYLLAFRKGGFDNRAFETYIHLIPKPDLLIVLLTSPEQCEERMNARAKGIASDILRTLPISQRMALLDHRLNTYTRMADAFETHNVPVMRVENTNHAATQALIVERLRSV